MKGVDERVSEANPPWVDFFAESPVAALDDLFNNAYYHGRLNAVEPEDLLLDWAGAIDSELFGESLDSALAEWIRWRWQEDDDSAGDSLGLMWQRALRVTALMDEVPRRAIDELRLRRSHVDNYLGPLVRNRACDPLGWYWATISRAQSDEGLVRQWFRMCGLAPGTPVFHGPWGLLGLQRAPGDDQGGFRLRVAAGLEQYLRALETRVSRNSLGRREAERYALGTAHDLSRRYPFPSRWREYWSNNYDLPPLARRWVTATWGEQVFRPPAHNSGRDWHKPRDIAAWPGRAKDIAERLGRSGDKTARSDADLLLGTQRSYAVNTGNSYYLVRTLCQFSSVITKANKRLAAAWAQEAMDWEPWNPYCWSAIISTKVAANEMDQAIRLSFEAVDRFPDDPVARNGLAKALREAGRLDEAVAASQDTITRFPDDQYGPNGLAEALRKAGRLDEAIAVYQDTITRFPGSPVARNGLAEALREAGRVDEAVAAYQDTITTFPGSPVARNGLAEARRQAGQLDEAVAAYQDTLTKFPGNQYALNGLAEALRQAGRLTEAVAAYRDTITSSPDDQYARNGLAEALRQTGRLDEAVAVYRDTITKFPASPVARNGLAGALRQAGRVDEAVAAYQDTLTRFPGNRVARNGLTEALRLARRQARAEELAAELAAERDEETATAPRDAGDQADDDSAGTPPGAAGQAPEQAAEAEAETDAAGATVAAQRDAGDQADDDTPELSADSGVESNASVYSTLRADMRRALLLTGQERDALLRSLVSEADDLLEINSHDVDALYSKVEALLALGSHTEVTQLLGSLPEYIAERPDFQAMDARLRMARLIASKPQPFDPSVVDSVIDSWNAAAQSSVELRDVATIASLRATAVMVDGASLQARQASATADLSRIISRQDARPSGDNTANLTTWWLTAVRHAISADGAGEELTYERIAPQLEERASLLDTLDGELVSAARYVYAPK